LLHCTCLHSRVTHLRHHCRRLPRTLSRASLAAACQQRRRRRLRVGRRVGARVRTAASSLPLVLLAHRQESQSNDGCAFCALPCSQKSKNAGYQIACVGSLCRPRCWCSACYALSGGQESKDIGHPVAGVNGPFVLLAGGQESHSST
jgi:hypothetical protein